MGAGGSKKVNPGLADTDKDGIISVEELDAMLQEAGFDWPRKRKEKLLGALDEDGNGKVGLAEFVKGTEQLLAVLEKLHAMGVVQLAAKAEELLQSERGRVAADVPEHLDVHFGEEVGLALERERRRESVDRDGAEAEAVLRRAKRGGERAHRERRGHEGAVEQSQRLRRRATEHGVDHRRCIIAWTNVARIP